MKRAADFSSSSQSHARGTDTFARLRSRNQVVGHLRKHREKTGISGDESHIREMQVTETRLHSF